MFELNADEFENLRCQIGTSSWGGTRYMPMAFTEQGVAMLSSVLSSGRAIQVNIQIMRAFTKHRQMISSHDDLRKKSNPWKRNMMSNSGLFLKRLRNYSELNQIQRKKSGLK